MARNFFAGSVFSGALPVATRRWRTNRPRFPCDYRADPTGGRSRHPLSANRKRRLVEHAAVRRLPSRGDAVLGARAKPTDRATAIDKKYLADKIESLLGSKEKLLASRIFPNPADPPDPRPQGRGLNMGLPFLAVAARSLPSLDDGQKQSLQLIAEQIVSKQQPDGSWEFFATLRRPPINESQTTDAAWIIMALEGETGRDASESQRTALRKRSPGSRLQSPPTSIKTRP